MADDKLRDAAAVTRAERRAARDVAIIAALKVRGTLAGAASDAGCDPRTVKRLIARSAEAKAAMQEGIAGLFLARLREVHATIVDEQGKVARHEREIIAIRDRLHAFAELPYSELRALDDKMATLERTSKDSRAMIKTAKRQSDAIVAQARAVGIHLDATA